MPWKQPSIGELRHKVTIQTATLTADGGGGYSDSWANATANATVWAKVEMLSGTRLIYAGQLMGGITHQVTTRYWGGLDPDTHRLTFTSTGTTHTLRILNITDPDYREQWMILDCEEKPVS